VFDDEGNPLDESTISSLLEGPKGLFSGNPGSLNYVDPKTNMNKIETLVASYGEKYQAALVEAYSGGKTQEQKDSILSQVSKEISAHIKENLVGNKDSPGELLSLLEKSGQNLQSQKNYEKDDAEGIGLTLAESPPEDDSQIG
jgi:septation ring formation regulator EzrA